MRKIYWPCTALLQKRKVHPCAGFWEEGCEETIWVFAFVGFLLRMWVCIKRWPSYHLILYKEGDNESKIVYNTIIFMVVNRLKHKKNAWMQNTRLCRQITYIDIHRFILINYDNCFKPLQWVGFWTHHDVHFELVKFCHDTSNHSGLLSRDIAAGEPEFLRGSGNRSSWNPESRSTHSSHSELQCCLLRCRNREGILWFGCTGAFHYLLKDINICGFSLHLSTFFSPFK